MWVRALVLAAGASVSSGVTTRFVDLPGRGLRMGYAVAGPRSGADAKPPLVFVHGAFHASWCFEEHWLEHFAERGHEAYAVSLRGTSPSPEPSARRIRVDEHTADLSAFLRAVVGRPAYLVGHSYGGAYVQKLLEQGEPALGAVLLCSVPPSGNGAMVWRFLRRSPAGALRITRGFALKSACRSVGDASSLFFSGSLPEREVRRHMARFAADSACGLDLPDFNRKLPDRGGAPPEWVRACPPVLVLGAERDAVVDGEAIAETARFYGASSALLPGLGHDVMLVPGWERAADAICEWVGAQPGGARRGARGAMT